MNDNIIRIGIIGDFDSARLSHIATNNAIKHSGDYLKLTYEITWAATEDILKEGGEILNPFHGIWCSPGSPYKSFEGALLGIQYARTKQIPFIGTCGGFQHAALEYAQNVMAMIIKKENASNLYENALFISQLSCSLVDQTKEIIIKPDTLAYNIYEKDSTRERYNCSFGLNKDFQFKLEDKGFRVTGTDEEEEARILELTEHPFYFATLFQPQLSSTSANPHKVVNKFMISAEEYKNKGGEVRRF